MNKKVEEIFILLNKRGKNSMHDVVSLKKAKAKIKQLAAKKNKCDLGEAGASLLEPATIQQLDNLILIYSGIEKSEDPNYDPLNGSGLFQDKEILKKYIDTVPNFVEDLAQHFKGFNSVFINKIGSIKRGGINSKRKPDITLMEKAKNIIIDFRNQRNYKGIDLSTTHTHQSLYDELKKRGFKGSLSWVKKHFATITKLS